MIFKEKNSWYFFLKYRRLSFLTGPCRIYLSRVYIWILILFLLLDCKLLEGTDCFILVPFLRDLCRVRLMLVSELCYCLSPLGVMASAQQVLIECHSPSVDGLVLPKQLP